MHMKMCIFLAMKNIGKGILHSKKEDLPHSCSKYLSKLSEILDEHSAVIFKKYAYYLPTMKRHMGLGGGGFRN